jgi:hypothetical protein
VPLLTNQTQAPSAIATWRDLWSAVERGWLTGDGVWSTPDPREPRASWFLFGDSAVIGSQGQRLFLHNTIVRFHQGHLTRIGGDSELIPSHANGMFYWNGPAVTVGSTLYVFAILISPLGGTNFIGQGHECAVFDIPASGGPIYRRTFAIPSTGRQDGEDILGWGVGAVIDSGFFYVFGAMRHWIGRKGYVARVAVESVEDTSQWRYWDGATWSASEGAAVPVLTSGALDASFSVHVIDGVWTIVSKNTTYGAHVLKYTAPAPTGPWTSVILYDVPPADRWRTYLAMYHPEVVLDSGKSVISLSRSPARQAALTDLYTRSKRFRPFWHGAVA